MTVVLLVAFVAWVVHAGHNVERWDTRDGSTPGPFAMWRWRP